MKLIIGVVMMAVMTVPASAQMYTRDGAVLGGAAGAITGGIIGHQNDETAEGALIGGAVGALAGGLLGHAKDEQMAREHYYQHRIWHQQQQQLLLKLQQQQAVSTAEVVKMSQCGLSESLIVNHIRTNGVQRRLDTHDIISLHQQGVSESVINAMQRAPVHTVTYVPAPAPPVRPTVVLREQYHVVPRYIPNPYPYGHGVYHWTARRPHRRY